MSDSINNLLNIQFPFFNHTLTPITNSQMCCIGSYVEWFRNDDGSRSGCCALLTDIVLGIIGVLATILTVGLILIPFWVEWRTQGENLQAQKVFEAKQGLLKQFKVKEQEAEILVTNLKQSITSLLQELTEAQKQSVTISDLNNQIHTSQTANLLKQETANKELRAKNQQLESTNQALTVRNEELNQVYLNSKSKLDLTCREQENERGVNATLQADHTQLNAKYETEKDAWSKIESELRNKIQEQEKEITAKGLSIEILSATHRTNTSLKQPSSAAATQSSNTKPSEPKPSADNKKIENQQDAWLDKLVGGISKNPKPPKKQQH